MKGINIFLADGFEDMEALGTNDVLRRGGINVKLISMNESTEVKSSRGVVINADTTFGKTDRRSNGTCASDIMIFPGGMPGTKNLAGNEELINIMKTHYASGGSVAAICAAPGLVLGQLGEELRDVEFTCFDGFQATPSEFGARFIPRPAIRCGRIVTGRSAGHAVSFGLAILEMISGKEAAEKVAFSLYLQTEQ